MDIKEEIKNYQMIIMALIVSLGIFFSCLTVANAIIKYQKINNQTISVTGSALKEVKSDFGVFTIYYEVRGNNLKEAYEKILADQEKIKDFVISKGFLIEDLTLNPINNYTLFTRTKEGFETNQVEGYRLTSNIKVSSKTISKITELSKSSTELIKENVEISSSNVEYFVTDLDNLKIEILKDASKNAKQRALSIVSSTGGKIGNLKSAKMGVFQIVPKNSTEVSDYGINDTISIDKKVIAVVNATFFTK